MTLVARTLRLAPLTLLTALTAVGCAAGHEHAAPVASASQVETLSQQLSVANDTIAALEARVDALEGAILPEARQKNPGFAIEADWVSPIAGGEGGISFEIGCPAGSFVTGLGGRAGAVVDRLAPVCQPLLVSQGSHGEPTQPGMAGGSGGTPYALACEGDTVAIGLEGRSGAVVDALRLVCAPVERTAEGGLRRTIDGVGAPTPEAGGAGGVDFSLMCPTGSVVSRIVGRAGAVVDSIGVACDPL